MLIVVYIQNIKCIKKYNKNFFENGINFLSGFCTSSSIEFIILTHIGNFVNENIP